jgi:multidrug/hemolysin transport system permease protein
MKKDLNALFSLTSRNITVFVKDKMFFFTSLITPLILLVLFVLFLKNVYVSSLEGVLAQFGLEVETNVAQSFANNWLLSSIFAASCVTMAFCIATIMVDDKTSGAINDINVSPVKHSVISLSYLLSTFITTVLFMFVVLAAGLIYLAATGFYLTAGDVFKCIASIILTCLFGSLLACIVMRYIKSQGATSAVATLVSSMYGFICGAYMPISSFPEAIRGFVMFIPGTYGSNIFRHAFLDSTIKAIDGLTPAASKAVRDGFDINLYFFDNAISIEADFLILGLSCAALLGLYLLLTFISAKQANKPARVKTKFKPKTKAG